MFTGSVFVLTSVTINLNSDKRRYDGPVPNGEDHGCTLKHTLLHETGHSFGEDHSSITSDVMYATDNNVVSIDADAHHMLAAVYGYDSPSDCNSCRFDFSLTPAVHQMSVGYFQQATTDKVNAAVGAAQSTVQDNQGVANDGIRYAECTTWVALQKCIDR